MFGGGRGPGPLQLNSTICSISLSTSYFFERIFGVKTSEVKEIVDEKWYNR